MKTYWAGLPPFADGVSPPPPKETELRVKRGRGSLFTRHVKADELRNSLFAALCITSGHAIWYYVLVTEIEDTEENRNFVAALALARDWSNLNV